MRMRVDQPRQDKPAVKIDNHARKRNLVLVPDAEDFVAFDGHPSTRKETITPVNG